MVVYVENASQGHHTFRPRKLELVPVCVLNAFFVHALTPVALDDTEADLGQTLLCHRGILRLSLEQSSNSLYLALKELYKTPFSKTRALRTTRRIGPPSLAGPPRPELTFLGDTTGIYTGCTTVVTRTCISHFRKLHGLFIFDNFKLLKNLKNSNIQIFGLEFFGDRRMTQTVEKRKCNLFRGYSDASVSIKPLQ